MKKFLFALCALGLLSLSGQAATFLYNRTITIDSSKVPGSDQTNFPVYLVLSDPGLKTIANGGHVQSSTGVDLTFFSDAALSQVLPYEVIAYDGAAGNLTAVVLCPTVSHSVSTVFYLGYGSTKITQSAANPTAVWAGYQGVYHMEDSAASTAVSNAANGFSGLGNGISANATSGMSATAKLGNGLLLNGTTDFIDLGTYATLNGASALTYSGWIKFSALTAYASILEKIDYPSGAGSGLSLSGSFQSTRTDWLAMARYNSASANYTNGFGITAGVWYYFSSVFSSGSVSLYINGSKISLVNAAGVPGSIPNAASDLLVGKSNDGSTNLNAELDEVRVSKKAFSANWIAAEYNNLNSPGTFALLGAEGQAGNTSPILPIAVKVVGTTPTQAILRYTAPDNNACQVQVSDDPSTNLYTGLLSSTVHDVDPVLFPGSNLDTRTGNFVNGTARTIVIGYRGVGDAADSNTYSRALQANTTHYYQIWCGSGAYLGSGAFTTANIPLGNGAPDPIQYDSNQWGGWGWPSINYADKTPAYIDPQTGVQLKRWTAPGDEGQYEYNIPFMGKVDLAGSWQNVQNIGQGGDGQYATYTGAGGPANALFLWGKLSYYRPSFIPVAWGMVDDVRINLNGFGDQAAAVDRTVSVCISPDYGQSCLGTPLDVVLPQGSTGNVSGPNPWPAPLFAGWGNAKVTADMMMNNFGGQIVSFDGNAVSWGSNTSTGYSVYFPATALKPGDVISIAGTDPACPKNLCTIASVSNEKSITIQQTVSNWNALFTTLAAPVQAGDTSFTVTASNGFVISVWGVFYLYLESDSVNCSTLTGNTFSGCSSISLAHPAGALAGQNQYFFPNFGFKLWKRTGTGTVSIDGANTDWADSSSMFTGYQGADAPYCSKSTVTATYAADGLTPIAPLAGYMCLLQSQWTTQRLYFIAPSTGETRKLSNLYNLVPSLDDSNPLRFYVFNYANNMIQVCTYNTADPVNGRFKAWDDGRNPAVNNPAIQCTNLSSPGQDVATEIKAAYPQIDQTYFGGPGLQSVSYPQFEFMLRPSQGAMAWFCVLDMSQPAGAAQVIKCRNSWDTYPVRWLGSHGNEYFEGSGYTLLGSQSALGSPGLNAAERWDLNITTIYNNSGSTALTTSFFDPQTCEQLGVTDSRWIALGATGRNCIRVNVDNEPMAKSPASGDLKPLGSLPVGARPAAWAHNAVSCGGDGTTAQCWSYLQPAQEGDFLQDIAQSVGDEKMMIAKKTVLSNGTIDLVIARNMNPFGCRASSVPMAHTSGWAPMMWPPQSCGSGYYHSRTSDPASATLVDNPQTYLGHTVAWVSAQHNEAHFTPYSTVYPKEMGGYGAGYGVRSGAFPGVVGKPFLYGVNDVYPFAGNANGLSIGQIQSHPGGITVAAPARESGWGLDGRPLGGSGGGDQFLWNQNITKVSGTQNVYSISLPLYSRQGPIITGGGWDVSLNRKRRQMLAFSGFHLLRDISGPGSQITDNTPWTYCIADLAGECVSGSQQGSQFVSVPYASTVGVCGDDGTVNAPCLAAAGAEAGAYTQFGIDRSDPFGLRWRKLTAMFGGPGRTDNYANMHPLATADWAVSAVKWGDGRRSDVFGVRLPPWPTEDSVARNTFVNVTVSLGGQPGSSARIRFGYDTNLYCSSRQEQCSTATANSDPYAWLSEPQNWTPCGGAAGCRINIPAVSSRILYYVVDRIAGSGTIASGPMMITNVN